MISVIEYLFLIFAILDFWESITGNKNIPYDTRLAVYAAMMIYVYNSDVN